MDAERTPFHEEKDRLLQRLAEIAVEEQRLLGTFDSVPHYGVLESAAHDLGQELSRRAQQRGVREVAAGSQATAACPACGQVCPTEMTKRTVNSLDGPVELFEPKASCPACRRAFFPSA